ncbi:caspase family protein [Streptomyces sp. NPDC059168]|uniref:caspase family protein n=1 Tax=Streptomyces sp. NPDC059168 TaxID=3346753 RepID=UPI0036BB836F
MTTVFTRTDLNGPAMHALVIGVGAYPYCDKDQDPQVSVAAKLKSLTTSEPTARAVAKWLLEKQRHDPTLPLGSLEMAISPLERETQCDIYGKSVERADFAGIQSAFAAWYERCDQRRDAVTFFYFVGHGCALKRGGQALLLENFGANPFNEFDDAADFDELYEGMGRCAAQSQLYFLDCCREVPEKLAEQVSTGARSLITPDGLTVHRTTAQILYASSRWHKAYGEDRKPSQFSVALEEAFDGLAAQRGRDGVWRVEADLLPQAVRDAIGFPSGPRNGMAPTSTGDVQNGLILRQLSRDPHVLFAMNCDPGEAGTDAEYLLLNPDGTVIDRRPPSSGSWTGRAKAGMYEAFARFGGRRWRDASSDMWAFPPTTEVEMKVEYL